VICKTWPAADGCDLYRDALPALLLLCVPNGPRDTKSVPATTDTKKSRPQPRTGTATGSRPNERLNGAIATGPG